MLNISKKIADFPQSAIRKLVPYADDAERRGIHVYRLNIGQPDIETPQAALHALADTPIKVLAYSHSAGNYSFREKWCEYYHRWGIELTPEQILVTSGGSEALLFGFMTCLDPGDEILIPEPFYTNYNAYAKMFGAVIKTIPSDIRDGFALPPVEEFEKVITPKTRAIMICNPNNPTGYLYSEEELRKIAAIVKEHDMYLFADEVYREFVYDGHKSFSVLQLEGLEENVVLFDSISKRYSACGSRIGALITRNEEVIKYAMRIAQARLCPPTLGQTFAEAAFNTPQSYFEAVGQEYVTRRDVLVKAINNIPGCFCPNPKGAFYTVAELPIDDSDRFCKWMLTDFSLNNNTVMFAPATGFYADPEKGRHQIRISYCLCVEDIIEAMFCLEAALKVYPGRTI